MLRSLSRSHKPDCTPAIRWRGKGTNRLAEFRRTYLSRATRGSARAARPGPPLDLGRFGSVPRYRRVHRGIGIEAAFEVQDPLEAGSPEGPGDVGAAVAVVADHDELACGVELGKTLLQSGHRDESRTLYAGGFELPRLAHIE